MTFPDQVRDPTRHPAWHFRGERETYQLTGMQILILPPSVLMIPIKIDRTNHRQETWLVKI